MRTVEITIKLRATIGMRLGAANRVAIKNHYEKAIDRVEDCYIDVGEDLEPLVTSFGVVSLTERSSRRRAKKIGKKR